jgi:hypothetical protein
MGYIGAQPATNFETVRKQVSTTNSGTTITLDFAVSSVQDILVTVNAVVQSYDNYSVSGTTLTLGGTLNNDRVEILYVGRTFQTVTPAVGTVTNDMLVNSSITLNGSAVSLGGSASVDNTPNFSATFSGTQTLSDAVDTKVNYTTEIYDSDSAYDSANAKFTVPSGKAGKYFISATMGAYSYAATDNHVVKLSIRKNGSLWRELAENYHTNYINQSALHINEVMDLAVSDYIEIYAQLNIASGNNGSIGDGGGSNVFANFCGFKLI